VRSSPYCRCQETARLAFGDFTLDTDLIYAFSTNQAETARLAAALKGMLSRPPPVGGNLVLVSHTANLKEATGIWPRPEAVAHVFRPGPSGAVIHLGRIEPQRWADLANGLAR
jgi:phosphohistidine phosphatase SixA